VRGSWRSIQLRNVMRPSGSSRFGPYIAATIAGVCLLLLMLALPLGAAGFVTEAFAGGSLIYLMSRPKRPDLLAAGLVGIVFGAAYKIAGATVERWIGWEVCFPAALYCFGVFVVLFFRCGAGPKKEASLTLIREMALIPAVCLCSIIAVTLDTHVVERIYDRWLYAFDLSLGFNPSFTSGEIFRAHSVFRSAASLIYSSLPVNLCLMCAIQMRHRIRGATDLRTVFVALGVVGFVLYHLCPATGPIYAFAGAYPDHPPDVAHLVTQTITVPGVPRNAIPSLHVAWCLLILYNSWSRSLLLKIYALICLFLTAAATLGTGEHYLIDLIVAFPLSVAVQMACSNPKKLLGPAVCLGMVVAWLLALRTGFGWQHADPVVPRILVAVTIVVSSIVGLAAYRSASQENNSGEKPQFSSVGSKTL
jgi:hypothetical protein